MELHDQNGVPSVVLDGNVGDILLNGADCAEIFPTYGNGIEPGCLVSAVKGGRVRLSRRPYDRKVVGVVSGLGSVRPGLILNRSAATKAHAPVGVSGRVVCKADAQFGRIDVGDLLTTSEVPGVAMKASHRDRAFGCVVGKALQPLAEGAGEIMVLVGLR